MNLSNYKTEYLQNALKHVNKNNETYGAIMQELDARKLNPAEQSSLEIDNLKHIKYQSNATDVDIFLKHYNLSTNLSYEQLRPFIELDKNKIADILKLYQKYVKQYIWHNVTYQGVYEAACRMLGNYANFQNMIKKHIEDLESNKHVATTTNTQTENIDETIHDLMEEFDVDFATGEKLLKAYKKYENDELSVTQQYHDGKLTSSQHDAIIQDMHDDYEVITDKLVEDNHNKQQVDKLLEYLNLSHVELEEAFLKYYDIVLDNIDKQSLGLQSIIHNHMLRFRDTIVSLKYHDDYNSGLTRLHDAHSNILESFYAEWQELKDKTAENQKKGKQFLLDMVDDDYDDDMPLLSKIRRDAKQSAPTVDLKSVKASLDKCYDNLNVIMDKIHNVYDAIDSAPKNNESSLSDIILMLMNMKTDYVDKQFTEHTDLYTYLKVYKTIQLSVGRFRGITDALHKLTKAVDIIVVPENHHKQQYSQLPCVVINPNELHLIPEHCPIGNIYIDYHRTMFDSEIKTIYEKLGRNHNQFFIMVG